MVLAQQVFPVVVAVGGAYDDVNVLAIGFAVGELATHADGALLVVFD